MPDNEFPKLKLHPFQARVRGGDTREPTGPSTGAGSGASDPPPYAELCVTSNYTFLTGASHPEEYVSRAAALGYHAVAITDTNTVAGVVRAHVAAKDAGVRFVLGCRLRLVDVPGASVFVYPTDMASYGRLCRLLTVGKRRAAKGQCHLWLEDVAGHHEGLVAIVEFDGDLPGEGSPPTGCSSSTEDSPPGPDSPPGGRTSVARGFSPWKGTEQPGTPEGGARASESSRVDDAEEGIEAARHRGIECEDLLRRLLAIFDHDRLSLAIRPTYAAERCEPDSAAMARTADLSRRTGVPLVATNGVHYHDASRRMLQDVLTCIRHACTIEQAGFRLHAGAERHLKAPDEMHRLLAAYPGAIERALSIVDRTRAFTLDDLRYEYPDEVVPQGVTPQEHLATLTWKGAAQRYPPSLYPDGVPEKVRRQIEHELALIDELGYARYFLTVHDLVRFAREEAGEAPILCQGRGAAANSAVCYCLGVTSVDPSRIDVLFERFVSRERNEPPDIDIDFEHERREEVIQYLYKKYGRDRAALTAEVISYRRRSAVRDVGKALGLSLDTVDRLAKDIEWFDRGGLKPARLREMGLNPDDPTMRWLARLSTEILGFPRHLSQHVGGFVITRRALCELVPVENAAMPDRTVIEWDKDDIDAMGMLKVDCLGLGMLTCIRRALEFVNGEGVEGAGCRGVGKESVGEERVEQEEAIGWDGVARPRAARACASSPRSGVRLLPGASAPGGGLFNTDRLPLSDSMPRCRAASMPSPPSSIPMDSEALAPPSGVPGSSGSFQGLKPLATLVRPPGKGPGEADTPPSAPSTPRHLGTSTPLALHTIPPEDPAVYEMICDADTVGVFQIESRAQMSMLPRLRPVCFYDLVIEVAIVRPGPIQGDMVHPYLRRRNGEEDVPENAHPAFKEVLGKTLGVPLFQEQCMALAVKAAGFTPGEADQLRRAMAAWKRKGDQIVRFGMKMIEGMVERGIPREFAERCFEQVKGFSSYGFPESHAASFALLVYASAWLKRHHPAEFAAALINSQPMGFYAPAQIIRDAKQHGVEVRPIDVNASGWDCRMEAGSDGGWREGMEVPGCPGAKDAEATGSRDGVARPRAARACASSPSGRPEVGQSPRVNNPLRRCVAVSLRRSPAIRLGMRLVTGLRQDEADRISHAVARHGPFDSMLDLWRASGVRAATMRRLAAADAFGSMGLSRQEALWHARLLRDDRLPLFEGHESLEADRPDLPDLGAQAHVVHDYNTTGLSLKQHPVWFAREHLARLGATPCQALLDPARTPEGSMVSVAGLVLNRQRPGTASGVTFMTIEDETGIANLVVWKQVYDRYRRQAGARLLLARGTVQREGKVVHVIVRRIRREDAALDGMAVRSRDFR